MRGAGLVDGDRGAVDEEDAAGGGGQQPRPPRTAAVGVDDLVTGGEHRDDDLGVGDRIRRRVDDAQAGGARHLPRAVHHVEPDDVVPGADEVAGHRQAHVAETEERDPHREAPISSRPMMTRMISFVPSRIWCTRRSRTIFSMP